MAPFKPLKILDRCKVAPPPGFVSPAFTDLPLTFFDMHWLPLPPLEFLFFYDFPCPISEFTLSILPRLKNSLSSTLLHFYPFSGNLSWPHEPNQPMIRFTEGDSVSFTVAEFNADFYHLSSNNPKDATESHPLLPQLPVSGPIIPLLAIQVTVFPNSGFCIGVTYQHSICDGRAFTHFMKTWASISKFEAGSLSSESLPFLDRTVIQENFGITKRYLEAVDRFMGSESVSGNRRLRMMDIELKPNMIRATFELNKSNCRRLKDWISAQYKKDDGIPPSRFVAICAYTWICLLKAEAKVGDLKTNNTTIFVLNVDCRSRLNPPIPETYFGNCIRPCVAMAEKSDLIKGGAAVAAQLIGNAMYETNKEILRGLGNRNISGLLGLQSGRGLAAAGSPQLGMYKTDFGFGRLKKLELSSIDRTGAMFLKESPDVDGGVEFDLVLSRQEMDAFVSVFYDELNALTCRSLL
ncbi:hypothetical protein NE237_002812 [Protea cynaroides]|uniref:Uncharacterized protein n=1 Tax=Protea cynaroides TaxID=273540 RepID=A0A9Q0KFP4_9MAGN|nr:hypothetical protein NE237_002812 [Protea cynaroides]